MHFRRRPSEESLSGKYRGEGVDLCWENSDEYGSFPRPQNTEPCLCKCRNEMPGVSCDPVDGEPLRLTAILVIDSAGDDLSDC